MKITKLGHCCLLINIQGKIFLTDPGSYTTEQNDVKNIDCVVISHEHSDHLHMESLKKVLENNPQAKVICNSSVGNILEKESIAFEKVGDGEKTTLEGIEISGYGIKHAPIYKDYEQVENTGYLFDKKLFYPGDAFHNPGIEVDVLAFPIAAPWANVTQSIEYVLEIKPRIAFSVHDGNLIRRKGITERLPRIFLPQSGITFISMELGVETEF